MYKIIACILLYTSNAFSKPNALESYKKSTELFDSYEKATLNNKKAEIAENWDKIREEYASQLELVENQQIEKIQQTISKYENELAIGTSTNLREDILLNLVILNDRLGDILFRRENRSYKRYKKTALAQLAEIESLKARKSKVEQALYLKAVILTNLNNTKQL